MILSMCIATLHNPGEVATYFSMQDLASTSKHLQDKAVPCSQDLGPPAVEPG
jgi:hypothetical protein